MYRTTLILLDHIRSPLKLLRESFDRERRGLERSRQADPDDPMAQKRHQMSMMRTTAKPDDDHHWRWNGKGWYTRPQWNNGRCPPNTEPTQHNTCIGPHDSDSNQYQRKDPEGSSYESPGHARWNRGGEIVRTPEIQNSRIFTKPGVRVNWDHPHGPRIYTPYESDTPRTLPDSPEHLPASMLSYKSGNRLSRRARARAPERARLAQHYINQGFDPNYVSQALGPREPQYDSRSLSDKNLDRLPDRISRARALRRQGVNDRRQREAEYAAYTQNYINQYGEHPFPERWSDDYDLHSRYYDRNYLNTELIGGYENHPGYPGHPDYPQFDGYPGGRRRSYPWEGQGQHDQSDDDPGRQRLRRRWPRTGARRDYHDITDPERFAARGSGRQHDSNRTRRRSPRGGGRGRTNFRGRGGRR